MEEKKSGGDCPKTRSATQSTQYSHYVFGDCFSPDLPINQLPAKVDVIKCFLFKKNEMLQQKQCKECEECHCAVLRKSEMEPILQGICQQIAQVWDRAGIPIVSPKAQVAQLKRLVFSKEMDGIRKHFTTHKDQPEHIASAFNKFTGLHDIAACRCFKGAKELSDVEKSVCTCEDIKKIPDDDLVFYCDQNNERKYKIDFAIDRQGSKLLNDISIRNEKNQKRKSIEQERLEQYKASKKLKSSNGVIDSDIDSHSVDSDSDIIEAECQDDEFDVGYKKQRDSTKVEYKNVIEYAIRSRLSDRVITGIVNATLRDLEIADESMYLCRSTVQRLKLKAEKEATKEQENKEKFVCLKFDGRNDTNTLITQNKKAKEEHVTVISEPGSEYVDHFTPSNGKSATLAEELHMLVLEKESSGSLRVIGADGTNVNTGEKGGAIKLLEDKLEQPLQWDICMLHGNELPFRHLFEFHDGKCKGPGVYEGPIGKDIMDNNKKGWASPVNFKPLSGGKVQTLPENFLKELSHDQRYLYDICHAVQSGNFPECMVTKPPGAVHQARWVTMANCILRLLVQTKRPTKKLLRLSSIIVQYYAPTFFQIKQNWHITQGARNFFFGLNLARSCLTKKELEIAMKIFQINGYFAHPEAILLTALTDEGLSNRSWAVKYILKDRERRKSSDFRTFKLQKLNFEASSYLELLGKDFENVPADLITEPPLTFDFSNADLEKCSMGEDLLFPDIPCHSQNVERAVACTTKVAETVVGYTKRHAHILLLNKSRQKISKNATKKDFIN